MHAPKLNDKLPILLRIRGLTLAFISGEKRPIIHGRDFYFRDFGGQNMFSPTVSNRSCILFRVLADFNM